MLDGIEDENVVTDASRQAILGMVGAGIRGGPLVQSLPRFVDAPGALFERGEVSFEAKNANAETVVLRYDVDAGPHLRFAGTPREVTLAPGAAARIDVPLVAEAPIAVRRFGAWADRMDCSKRRLAKTRCASSSRMRCYRCRPSPCPPAAPSSMAISASGRNCRSRCCGQGDVASKPTAATDVSFAFGMRESDGDIYLAARVVDDDLVASTGTRPRRAGRAGAVRGRSPGTRTLRQRAALSRHATRPLGADGAGADDVGGGGAGRHREAAGRLARRRGLAHGAHGERLRRGGPRCPASS